MTDQQLIASIKALPDINDRMKGFLAEIHIERGDREAANNSLETFVGNQPKWTNVKEMLDSTYEQTSLWSFCLHEFRKHSQNVTSVAITPDGSWGLSGGKDNRICLWDIIKGGLKRSCIGHEKEVTCVAISNDGLLAASGSEDHQLRLWNIQSGDNIGDLHKELNQPIPIVTSLLFFKNKKHLLAGYSDGSMRLWNIPTGKIEKQYERHSAAISCINISPDERLALSGGKDKAVRVWDIQTGKCLQTLIGHKTFINGVAFIGDTRQVLSASGSITKEDTVIRIWDSVSGKELQGLVGHAGGINGIVSSIDGSIGLSSSGWGIVMNEETSIRIWFIPQRQCLRTLVGHSGGTQAIAMTPDGHLAISGGGDSRVRIWNLASKRSRKASYALTMVTTTKNLSETAKKARELVAQARRYLLEGNIQSSAECIQQARSLSGFERNSELLDLWWEIARQAQKIELKDAWQIGNMIISEGRGAIRSLGLSADGTRLVSCSMDGMLRLWDLKARACTFILNEGKSNVLDVAIVPNGKKAITGDTNGQVVLWDLNSSKPTSSVLGTHAKPVCSVTISGDGQFGFSLSDDGYIRLWNLSSHDCSCTFQIKGGRVSIVSVSHNGRIVVVGGRSRWMEVWDAWNGNRLRAWQGKMAECVAVSGCGDLAITGDINGIVRAWELATGTEVAPIGAHTKSVWGATVATDGKTVFMVGADSKIRVWDLLTGRCLKVISGEQVSPIRSVQVSRNCRFVVVGDEDGRISIWELNWNLGFERKDNWYEEAVPLLSLYISRSSEKHNVKDSVFNEILPAILSELGDIGLGWVKETDLLQTFERMVQDDHYSSLPIPLHNRFLTELNAIKHELATVGERVWSTLCTSCKNRSFFPSQIAQGQWYTCGSCHRPVVANGKLNEFVKARCRCGTIILCSDIEDPVACPKCGDFMFVSVSEVTDGSSRRTENQKPKANQEQRSSEKEKAMDRLSRLFGRKKENSKGQVATTPAALASGSQTDTSRGKQVELANKLLTMKDVPVNVRPLLEQCAQAISDRRNLSNETGNFVAQIEMLMRLANSLAQAGRQDLGSEVLDIMRNMPEALDAGKSMGPSANDQSLSTSVRDVFLTILTRKAASKSSCGTNGQSAPDVTLCSHGYVFESHLGGKLLVVQPAPAGDVPSVKPTYSHLTGLGEHTVRLWCDAFEAFSQARASGHAIESTCGVSVLGCESEWPPAELRLIIEEGLVRGVRMVCADKLYGNFAQESQLREVENFIQTHLKRCDLLLRKLKKIDIPCHPKLTMLLKLPGINMDTIQADFVE
jgi:WD40 repeat protein